MPAKAHPLRAALLPLVTTALTVTALTLPAPPAEGATGRTVTAMEPQQTLTASRTVRRTKVERALGIARAQKGDPYAYGAAGPNAFDCSGLVYFAARRAGFSNVPRTSSAQAGFMRRIAKSNVRIGDYVFFTDGGGVYHVGLYVGSRRVLHAPYSGTRVRVDPIWSSSWFAGTLRRR